MRTTHRSTCAITTSSSLWALSSLRSTIRSRLSAVSTECLCRRWRPTSRSLACASAARSWPGPWFQWHFDSFTPPPGARLIAETDIGPQAYVAGRSLGLQFHPEVTTEIMDEWVRVYPHELEAEGVDPNGLLDETHRRAAAAKRNTWELLNRF